MPTVFHQWPLPTLVALALVVASVVLVRRAVRRFRRLRRDLWAAMNAVARGWTFLPASPAIHARVWLPRSGRDVALVRRDVRRDLTGAARAVTAGRKAGRPVQMLDSVVRRLSAQAHALDVDLQVIGAEPDRRVRRQLLAAQEEPVRVLRRACAQIRRGVMLAGAATNEPLLGGLKDDLDDEMVTLGLRARVYRELAGR